MLHLNLLKWKTENITHIFIKLFEYIYLANLYTLYNNVVIKTLDCWGTSVCMRHPV